VTGVAQVKPFFTEQMVQMSFGGERRMEDL